MQNIEILEVKENDDPNIPVVCHALIEVGGKIKMWFVILRSKEGRLYCRPPSVLIDKKFIVCFELIDGEKMKELTKNILKELANKEHIK